MFTVAGLIGIVVTLLVSGSRSYRELSDGWEAASVEEPAPAAVSRAFLTALAEPAVDLDPMIRHSVAGWS